MKMMGKLMLVVVAMLASSSVFAANFDGTYKFNSRMKDGNADMSGWTGEMKIANNTISRTYHSPDGKSEKFYIGDLTQKGDLYTVKYTKAYKPEYVGNEHTNKMTVQGNALTIEATDGKFKEVWTKK
ncbi:MAG: hypothetical protein HY540_07720 [Deltaproteobacteria bacterium]|nr:hypothetical protein [Deltaproteobacteria bacterium]